MLEMVKFYVKMLLKEQHLGVCYLQSRVPVPCSSRVLWVGFLWENKICSLREQNLCSSLSPSCFLRFLVEDEKYIPLLHSVSLTLLIFFF